MQHRLSSHAPVHEAKIDRDLLATGVIQGFAAPERGPNPCRLELVAGGQVVSVANANGFSEMAQAAGVRFGWCRFDLVGLSMAGALGETAHLRCAISGNLIESIDLEALTLAPVRRPALSAPKLKTYISGLSGCSQLRQIMPFGEWYRAHRGESAFIDASYNYLHGRHADGEEISIFMRTLPEGWGVMDCWDKIVESQEYADRRNWELCGVFSPGFPFGRELFG
jgi:hypothetical protein